ncbi:helix-turn-helix transcriptional regulator [Lactobacillus salivarius]|uniref:helix-turn-helix domain-containing protein n=2 Tax=Ligilactobacillus salivarius TaxID=1624 RepID=UPI0015C65724|nr:helix-turn-helix transcriptional regulator [Ligilactobacillus salivarius]NXZ96431.1 helix-turn-helix transcriptional regulator [Ligilactobacillus salivarius]NYA74191.1 helix-turn-helix transcriptional regulator [Ligilactobacillus salivarius]UHL93268.1 helix-turn-helix transcriptional regulator [Ligilactobacillus salivarius]
MNKIRELRKERKLTLKQVSKDTNIPISTLSSYEKGDRQPKIDKISTLANYFGVSTYYLQGITEEKDWTPEKIINMQIKEFNDKYGYDKKIIDTIPDEIKLILSHNDSNFSDLQEMLLSSGKKNDNAISSNVLLMCIISNLIEMIIRKLGKSYFPSKNNDISEVDNEKMINLSMKYALILMDATNEIDEYNPKESEVKWSDVVEALDIDTMDLLNNNGRKVIELINDNKDKVIDFLKSKKNSKDNK